MTIYQNYDELCRKTKQMPPDTDLLAFTNLYKRFGIECKIQRWMGGYCIDLFVSEGLNEEGKTIHKKIDSGTRGEHFSRIYFDGVGKFISHNIEY